MTPYTFAPVGQSVTRYRVWKLWTTDAPAAARRRIVAIEKAHLAAGLDGGEG